MASPELVCPRWEQSGSVPGNTSLASPGLDLEGQRSRPVAALASLEVGFETGSVAAASSDELRGGERAGPGEARRTTGCSILIQFQADRAAPSAPADADMCSGLGEKELWFGISIVHRIDHARLSRSGLLRAILAGVNRKGFADMEARLGQDEEASSSVEEEDSEEQEDGFGSDALQKMLSHVPSFDRS